MTNEELQLKKRFCELAERANKSGVYTSTEFLSPAEQALLKSSAVDVPYLFSADMKEPKRLLRFLALKKYAAINRAPR